MAVALGVEVVGLDLAQPFTASRARNAGVRRLMEINPHVEFIQVIDGDCELIEGWIDAALETMADPKIAVVCGRRRERHPDASLYNRLCDIEWNTPIGAAAFCGGDALIRASALQQVRGYSESMIAGEEPEMCMRMRLRGWRVLRIERDMTWHDAQMMHFGQWWRRMVRSGHAYAECRALHGRAPAKFFVHEVRSIIEWALLLPLTAFAAAWWTWGASLALFALYGVLWRRIYRYRLSQGDTTAIASLYANYCVLGKFAEMAGIARYWFNRIRGRQSKLIEYKRADASHIAREIPGALQS